MLGLERRDVLWFTPTRPYLLDLYMSLYYDYIHFHPVESAIS